MYDIELILPYTKSILQMSTFSTCTLAVVLSTQIAPRARKLQTSPVSSFLNHYVRKSQSKLLCRPETTCMSLLVDSIQKEDGHGQKPCSVSPFNKYDII